MSKKQIYIADGQIFDGVKWYMPGDEIELTEDEAKVHLKFRILRKKSATSAADHKTTPNKKGPLTRTTESQEGETSQDSSILIEAQSAESPGSAGVAEHEIEPLFNSALFVGVITKKGNWYSCGETNLGQGKATALNSLKANPGLLVSIREEVASIPKNDK